MHHHFRDITDKLGPPLWYDENAVPRYCTFGPNEVANIYASQVALLEIACQQCSTSFLVAMSWSMMQYDLERPERSLLNDIKSKLLHWGDPPNSSCCGAGPTMNCIDKRVLEFWLRSEKSFKWKRDRKWEINLEDLEQT